MKTALKLNIFGAFACAIFVGGSVLLAQPAVAADKSSNKDDKKTQTTNNGKEKKKDDKSAKPQTYVYAAQSGDSYSKMARKAIQTYGIQNKVKLSQAEIIAAETKLTQEAGSPQLLSGQKVAIDKTTVKKWVDSAQKLSDADEAKWQKYTTGVNFDTRSVGERA